MYGDHRDLHVLTPSFPTRRSSDPHWPDFDSAPLDGLVVTRYGHAGPCRRIEVVEAAHPVPDQAGLDAARRILEKVQGLGRDDLVICLISGEIGSASCRERV